MQRLAEKIVLLLGFEDFDWGGLGKSGGTTSDALSTIYDETEDVSDAMGDATKKAKEFQNQLLGFDEAYKLSEPTEDTSSSATGAGLSGPDTAALDAAFKKIANEYQAAWTAAFEKMEQESTAIADRITGYFNKIYKAAEPLRKSLKNLWNDGFKKLLKFKSDALKDFYNDFLKPLGKWTLGKGLPKLVDALNDFLNKINWGKLRANLSDFWKGIEPFVEGFGDGFISFFAGLSKIGASVINGLGNVIGSFGRILQSIGIDDIFELGRGFGKLAAAIISLKGLNLIVSAVMGAITAHPYIALATSIGLFVGAFGNLVHGIEIGDKSDAWTDLPNKIKNLLEASEGFNNSYKELSQTNINSISEIISEYDGIREMANVYLEMSQNYNDLTDEQKKLVQTYAQTLSEKVGGIESNIDAITGAWSGTTEELQKAIDKQEEYALNTAKSDIVGNLYKQLAESKKGYDDSFSEFKKSVSDLFEYTDAIQDSSATKAIKYLSDVGFNTSELTAQQLSLVHTVRTENEVFDAYLDRVEASSKAMYDYSDTLGDIQDDISYYNDLTLDSIKNNDNWKEISTKNSEEVKNKTNSDMKEITNSTLQTYNHLSNNIKELEEKAKGSHEGIGRSFGETTQSIVQDSQNMESQVKQTHEGMGKDFGETTSKMQSDSLKTTSVINTEFGKIRIPQMTLNTSPLINAAYNAINHINDLTANGLQTAKIDVDTNEAESKVQTFLNTINKSFGNIKLGFSAFGSTMNLPKYAVGGFPEDGLFYANHNELVGEFSNGKTAVANNGQITEGIANAVYRAFVEANINSGTNNQQPIIKVYVGNKEIGDIAIEEINNRTVSNGKSPLYY